MRLTYMLKFREVSGYVSSCEVSDDELIAIYEIIEPIVWTIRANRKQGEPPLQVAQLVAEMESIPEPTTPKKWSKPKIASCAQCGKKYTRAGLSRHAKATGHVVKPLELEAGGE